MAHPVFGFHRRADDGIARSPVAGVVAETDQIGHGGELVDQCDVIQIDNAAPVGHGGGKLLAGRVVGGEHQVFAVASRPAAQFQFGHRTAVEAEAHVGHNGKYGGVGQGLHRIELPEAGDAAKMIV